MSNSRVVTMCRLQPEAYISWIACLRPFHKLPSLPSEQTFQVAPDLLHPPKQSKFNQLLTLRARTASPIRLCLTTMTTEAISMMVMTTITTSFGEEMMPMATIFSSTDLATATTKDLPIKVQAKAQARNEATVAGHQA